MQSCDRNDNAPEIIDQVFYVDENSEAGTLVGKIEADDSDEMQTLSFEIFEGNNENVFSLEQETGYLFVSNPSVLDFEKTTKMSLQVAVSDNHPNEPLESTASILVVINNLNEHAPVIEDQTFSVNERSLTGSIIGTIVATDADSGQLLTFRIVSGDDNHVVQLDSVTGVLSVKDSIWFDYNVNQELVCMVSVCDNDSVESFRSYALVTIEVVDIPFKTIDINGYVQKGPFILGSAITISELDLYLNPTGRVFTTQILDNTGKYELPDVDFTSPFILLKADGFYFNERSDELSEAQLTLHSLVDITNHESFNINLISHLEKDRIIELMNSGMVFTEAKIQARDDILGIFNFESVDQLQSEQMDISNSGEDNALLLAVSLILQGNRTTGELSELINQISLDYKTDGVMNNESIGTELINGINSANLQIIRENIEQRYESFGIEFDIPDYEKYVNLFINETSFVATNQITFPAQGTFGFNALQYEVTEVEDCRINDRDYSFAVDVPEGRSFEVKVIGKGVGFVWGSLLNMDRFRVTEPEEYSVYSSTSTGRCDVKIRFYHDYENPSNNLKFEYYSDGNTDPYFTKEVEIWTDTVPIDSTLLK